MGGLCSPSVLAAFLALVLVAGLVPLLFGQVLFSVLFRLYVFPLFGQALLALCCCGFCLPLYVGMFRVLFILAGIASLSVFAGSAPLSFGGVSCHFVLAFVV